MRRLSWNYNIADIAVNMVNKNYNSRQSKVETTVYIMYHYSQLKHIYQIFLLSHNIDKTVALTLIRNNNICALCQWKMRL